MKVKQIKNIGIWVKNKKIAAIGIRVSRWVAFHGCSINIKNNLEDYKNINPCGLNNSLVTNLRSETKEDLIDIDNKLKKNLFKKILIKFKNFFNKFFKFFIIFCFKVIFNTVYHKFYFISM